MNSPVAKRLFIAVWLSVIFAGICCIFWYADWQYSQPTPVPVAYKPVNTGQQIDLGPSLSLDAGKPALVHFFNPACPCSRFNIDHFRSLVKQYGERISFAVVVLTKDRSLTARDIQDKYSLSIPVSFDTSLASACGVYSTPQAVLLDAGGKLYYRGNYNRERYCTDARSNYAQIAINSLLNNKQLPEAIDRTALKPYGCQLPGCKK